MIPVESMSLRRTDKEGWFLFVTDPVEQCRTGKFQREGVGGGVAYPRWDARSAAQLYNHPIAQRVLDYTFYHTNVAFCICGATTCAFTMHG